GLSSTLREAQVRAERAGPGHASIVAVENARDPAQLGPERRGFLLERRCPRQCEEEWFRVADRLCDRLTSAQLRRPPTKIVPLAHPGQRQGEAPGALHLRRRWHFLEVEAVGKVDNTSHQLDHAPSICAAYALEAPTVAQRGLDRGEVRLTRSADVVEVRRVEEQLRAVDDRRDAEQRHLASGARPRV